MEKKFVCYKLINCVEAVTILECPSMTIVGIVGYVETPNGLRALTTVWSTYMSNSCKRRFYKNWYKSKKKAFTRYAKNVLQSQTKCDKRDIELEKIKKYCQVVRVIAHTQIDRLNLRYKKAHIMEIQINGETVEKKVEWAKGKISEWPH
jgi:large subunit ribosomal protein L3e